MIDCNPSVKVVFYFQCRIRIQTLVTIIMEHIELHICRIMLKATKFVDCYEGRLMLALSLLLAVQTRLATTMP